MCRDKRGTEQQGTGIRGQGSGIREQKYALVEVRGSHPYYDETVERMGQPASEGAPAARFAGSIILRIEVSVFRQPQKLAGEKHP